MGDLLFRIEVTPQIIFLSLILLVIGRGLKDISFIKSWLIIWILLTISIIVDFVFIDISYQSLFEAIISTALATLIYQAYKQTKKGIKEARMMKISNIN